MNGSLPRLAFVTGFVLFFLLGGMLALVYVVTGGVFTDPFQERPFYELLQDFDFKYRQAAGRVASFEEPAALYQELDGLSRDLDYLEKRAEGVESWLSVLKRRRQLAVFAGRQTGLDTRYTQNYRQSARRAVKAFPHAEPLAAVLASALIHESAITGETETELRTVLPVLASPLFAPARLSLHVLLGDFRSPERAAATLLDDGDLSLDLVIRGHPATLGIETEAIITDLVILKILAGDTAGALAVIQTALGRAGTPSVDFVRLAAEYFYDFGDLLRAAELFYYLPGEADLSRQADTLWLAGYPDNARNIWAILAASPTADRSGLLPAAGSQVPGARATLRGRALYNLALTAPTLEESVSLLQQLVREGDPGDASRQFGLIRFSRLLETSRAIAVLQEHRGPLGLIPVGDELSTDAVIDLEVLKRRTENGRVNLMIAQTWQLFDRYPRVESLYRWGAWYFDLQRNAEESALLLRRAGRNEFSGYWLNIHLALQLIREGEFNAAERLLLATYAENGDWVSAANLGRLSEARLSLSRAVDYYERAVDLAVVVSRNPPAGRLNTASQIQVRIARCVV